jgi:Domain of unknown function (DUF4351)
MSQFPHDRFNKNLLDLRLSPFCEVKTQRKLDPETTFVDIYCVPRQPIPADVQLGLLAKCIGGQTVAFEPYRNPVEVDAIQDCIVKALQIQQEERKEANVSMPFQPRMWIVTPTLAEAKLVMFGAMVDSTKEVTGIYQLAPGLQTGIIVVHQLPSTPETLLLRLMGKGRVQQAAMTEVAALGADAPYRTGLLDLLASYRMELAAKQNAEPEEQELIMQLSPLYLEQLATARQDGQQIGQQIGQQQGQQTGQQELVLQQLHEQVGEISVAVMEQIRSLSIPQLKSLATALLKFQHPSDLQAWLQNNAER